MRLFFTVLLFVLLSPGNIYAFQVFQSVEKCGTTHVIDSLRSGKLVDSNFFITNTEELNSYQSESGRFIFWYTLSGSNAISGSDTNDSGIPDWVETAAEAADSSWAYYVDYLGFKPPLDEGQSYSFYFQNLDFYGFTGFIEGELVTTIDSTFDWIDGNDAPNPQIGALQITIAHEFYHVIQYNYNQWQGPSGSTAWIEIDAVNAENLVFPDVNEYRNYLDENSIFRAPSQSVPVVYHHVTWVKYFTEQFGNDFFKYVWDKIDESPNISMVDAIRDVLTDLETTFDEHLIRLHAWHLASGNWSRNGYGFEFATDYPTSFKRSQRTTVPTSPYPVWLIEGFAANYHAIIPSPNDSGEALIAFYTEDSFTGLAILIYTNDGQIIEQIYVPDGNKVRLIDTGFLWQEIEQIGLAKINLDADKTHIHQTIVGAGNNIEQILYGDANRNGAVDVNDVLFILDEYVNPELNQVILTNRTAAGVAGHETFSAFDAALIFKSVSGFQQSYPADLNQSGYGPEFESFFDIEILSTNGFQNNQANPILRIDKIQNDDDNDIRLSVELLGFDEPVSSITLIYEQSNEIIKTESVTSTGSMFDEILFAFNQTNLSTHVAWVSNQSKAGSYLGTLIMEANEAGIVTVQPISIKINNQIIDAEMQGITFSVENNPAVSVNPDEIPSTFELHQNYPNPFNPSTNISFSLTEAAGVLIEVFNPSGQHVQTIANGSYQPGRHITVFDADNLSSGMYIYRMSVRSSTTTFIETKKMLLIK